MTQEERDALKSGDVTMYEYIASDKTNTFVIICDYDNTDHVYLTCLSRQVKDLSKSRFLEESIVWKSQD